MDSGMKDENWGWKDAIVDVLKSAKEPLHYKKITSRISFLLIHHLVRDES
jgi:hypothetical protein